MSESNPNSPQAPSPTPKRMLEQSTLELYAGIIIGICLVVIPMNAVTRCIFLLVVLGLLIDVCWRASWTINWEQRTKIMMTVFLVAGYGVVAVALITYERQARANPEVVKQIPAPIITPSPITTSTLTPSVYSEFQSIYETYKEKLGQPEKDAEPLKPGYFAEYEHATVIWIRHMRKFYLLRVDQTWTLLPDRWDNPAESWASDDCNRKRFGTPKDKYPPFGGVAFGWYHDRDKWQWIGWRLWHCYYIKGPTHVQRFKGGLIMGWFRHPEDAYAHSYILTTEDQKWFAEEEEREGASCDNPSEAGDPCKIEITPLSK